VENLVDIREASNQCSTLEQHSTYVSAKVPLTKAFVRELFPTARKPRIATFLCTSCGSLGGMIAVYFVASNNIYCSQKEIKMTFVMNLASVGFYASPATSTKAAQSVGRHEGKKA
jgi:hypothetical protein